MKRLTKLKAFQHRKANFLRSDFEKLRKTWENPLPKDKPIFDTMLRGIIKLAIGCYHKVWTLTLVQHFSNKYRSYVQTRIVENCVSLKGSPKFYVIDLNLLPPSPSRLLLCRSQLPKSSMDNHHYNRFS